MFQPQDFGALCSTTVFLHDDAATHALGAALYDIASSQRFIGLIGPLGAGKTTLMKGLVAQFGLFGDDVTSPTYTLVNEYEGAARLCIAHMDLYRLSHVDDLEGIGYWDYLDDPDTIVCVEWLNTLPDAWPRRGCIVHLSPEQNGRLATLYGSQQQMIDDVLVAFESNGSKV